MVASSDRAVGVSLRGVLPESQWRGATDVRVTSCTSDSRACQPGDLFVALPGTRRDGHDYLLEAVSRGARAVLVERTVPDVGVPICLVPNAREAYGRICQALAGNPSQRVKVVGLTGTNGKTTTSFLVASVLDAGGYASGLLGTLGYFDGLDWERGALTTPAAPTLATWLARMEVNGCSHAVMEVSSHALVQQRLAGMVLEAAAVTNVGHDHLDYHHDHESYRRAKCRIVNHLDDHGLLVVNADDEGSASVLDCWDGPAISVGIEAAAEITATPLECCVSEQTFLLSAGDDSVPVRTTLIGVPNIYNCLVAAALGLGHGLDLATVVRGLEAVVRVPGRLERIECGQPFGVFVDFAHTPEALAGCLDTLRPLVSGRLIVVFGAGGDRDRSKRPWMGRVAQARADLVVLTSDNPRSESPTAIIDDILAGCRNRTRVEVRADRAAAIRWALRQARPGDTVLIAGKGHETYQIIGSEQIDFDDREIARQCLYDLAPGDESLRASA